MEGLLEREKERGGREERVEEGRWRKRDGGREGRRKRREGRERGKDKGREEERQGKEPVAHQEYNKVANGQPLPFTLSHVPHTIY